MPTLQKRMCPVVGPLQVSLDRQEEPRIGLQAMDGGVRLHDDEGVFAKNRAEQRVWTVGQGGGRTPEQGISGLGQRPEGSLGSQPAVRVNWTCVIRMNPPLGMKTP